jgi:hypothetical protein
MTPALQPVASDETLQALWDTLPKGRFVGNASVVTHEQVEFVGNLVDDSGVVGFIENCQLEDRAKTGAGGQPRIVSTRTIIILFLVLTIDHSAQLVEELAVLVHQRLRPESLTYLGLDGNAQMTMNRRPGAKRVRRARSKRGWAALLWRTLERTLAPLDSKPKPPALVDGKGNRRRGKMPTLAEVEDLKTSWTAEHLEVRLRRLETVVHELIEATNRLEPEEFAVEWMGDTCVDASVVPAWGKRGAPFGGTHGASDPSGGWYMRDSKWEPTETKKKAIKAVYGFDLTLILRTNHDPEKLVRHSTLIAGMALNVPSTALIPAAVGAYERIAAHGHPIGRATGDRGYAALAVAEDYQLPLRKMGYEILTDYKSTQLGIDNDGGYAGAIQVEGAHYCPAMPEGLVNATKNARAGGITNGEWRDQIDERKYFALRPKEAPDAKGRQPMMCPARGPGATVSCPIVEKQTGVRGKPTKKIRKPPPEAEQDEICTNKQSVSFPARAGAKLAQKQQFGSRTWQIQYTSDRNTIEGGNAYMKDDSKEQLGAPGRRRKRGIAAQTLFIGFLVVSANLRKLQAARDEWNESTTDAEREARRQAKADYRDARRSRDDRVAPWDNFPLKNAIEGDRESPTQATVPGDPPEPFELMLV